MNANDHPFTIIQKLITEDNEKRLKNCEAKIEKLETRNTQRDIGLFIDNAISKKMNNPLFINQIQRLLPINQNEKPKSIIKNSILTSAFFSLIFSSIFIFSYLTFFHQNFQINHKNEVSDSIKLQKLSPIEQFIQFLIAKEMPVLYENQKTYFNSYQLNDIYKIYFWATNFNIPFSQLHLVVPIDFIDHIDSDNLSSFSDFFPYSLELSPNNNHEVSIIIQGIDSKFPDKHKDFFSHIFQHKMNFIYEQIQLPTLFFSLNSSELDIENENKLVSLITFMKKTSNISLIITGHADRLGEEKINKDLSCKRARTVEAFFMKNLVSGTRLETRCFSNFQANSQIQEKNRKVEFQWKID